MSSTDRLVPAGAVELMITEAGSDGRPLLLLHGYTGARSDFEDFIAPLAAEGWHVIAPDLRGHGQSSKPTTEDDYSLRIFADDAVALIDALGLNEVTVLGHSMGGMVAQEMVLAAPGRVGALILMDTSHGPLAVDADLVELGVQSARGEGIDFIADVLATTDDGPLASAPHRRKLAEDPTYRERGDRNLRASSAAMYAAMILEITSHADRLERLVEIAVPTLVVVGEEDAPFLADSRRMAETIAGARLAVIPDGGHSPQFEAPAAWWAAVSEFLAEVSSGVARTPVATTTTDSSGSTADSA